MFSVGGSEGRMGGFTEICLCRIIMGPYAIMGQEARPQAQKGSYEALPCQYRKGREGHGRGIVRMGV